MVDKISECDKTINLTVAKEAIKRLILHVGCLNMKQCLEFISQVGRNDQSYAASIVN